MIFHGSVWVPLGVGPGPARVTLTYPGLEEWNVRTTTLEVPVEAVRVQGWLWYTVPWCAGALLVAGIAWLVRRRLARRRRTVP